MSLRSGRNLSSAAGASVGHQRKESAKKSTKSNKNSSRKGNQPQQPTPAPRDQSNGNRGASDGINPPENNPQTPLNNPQTNRHTSSDRQQKSKDFNSRFPALDIENMEQELNKWTLVDLRKALAEEKKNRSRHKNQAPAEIEDLVQLIRLDYEKRMLMAALIGGISGTMVWSLVNVGPARGKSSSWSRFLSFGHAALAVEMPHRNDKAGWALRNKETRDIWEKMSIYEKMVFKSPYFFALAKLPDLSKSSVVSEEVESDDQDINEEDISAQVSPPAVHQLSEEEELLYRPIFDKLVDVEKVQLNHGKPESSDTIASLQLKSLAAFRVAHHNFATACQRFHIHYYLAALSCDITNDGWNEVYSTNKSFAEWANENMSLTTKFKYYIHGKAVAREIERKPSQPVDARRGELTRELNYLSQNQRSCGCYKKSRMAYPPGTYSTP
ncbi:hypothetical protein DFH28DRAFT_902725 [Melampsora americana]|nr:hypothetical protein DFH28DRAFT_902725 [Melampsora americana]